MDLALALVEEDLGRALASQVACSMVLFLRRPGTQSQFSRQLALQHADRQPIRELQGWMEDHLDADLSVASLAARVGMSSRHFARVFTREVGVTPSRYVEQLRIDTARRWLEESDQPLKVIAAETGLGSAETLRRLFLRTFCTPPATYRDRFRSSWVQ
jgi:transcriptional regulator GlxA family with amidase domain